MIRVGRVLIKRLPVKTTGEAGGLSKPYKGMIQLRLKAQEKFATRKC